MKATSTAIRKDTGPAESAPQPLPNISASKMASGRNATIQLSSDTSGMISPLCDFGFHRLGSASARCFPSPCSALPAFSLPAHGDPLASRIGAGREHASLGIAARDHGVAKNVAHVLDRLGLVAALAEILDHIRAKALLDPQVLEILAPGPAEQPARRVHAMLHVHAEIEIAGDEHGAGLWLPLAAH